MKIFFNKMQREVMAVGARDSYVVAGRGTGKGLVHAATNLRNFQAMPRSTTGLIAPYANRAKSNTIPSMTMHWEAWGYKKDVHWCIGKRPPKALGWPKPLIEPEHWENIISFYTGAIAQIISQDRSGSFISKSLDFLDIDEAKFIDYEKLKNETFQANRGQINEFGGCPWHHESLVTSDLTLSPKGAWFMRYEKEMDAELIELIEGLVAEIAVVKERMAQSRNAADYHVKRLAFLHRKLDGLRRHALLFRKYSSLTNMEVLGEEFISQQRRNLPLLIFQTSILCLPVTMLHDGFYSSMKPFHKYAKSDFHFMDNSEYSDVPVALDCRSDGDIDPEKPLCIAFDFNRNINWLVCGQPDYEERRICTLKSFFVKYERKLPALIADFCTYYHYFKLHEVIFYYDSTALGSNYAVNDDDFQRVICRELEKHGWKVEPIYIGNPMNHADKHLLINQGFAGQNDLMPFFNEPNNEDLLVSIQTAGVYNGKKDKRGEKFAETDEDRLEARTDGSDAWDTLYIGCLRFPAEIGFLGSSSNSR